MPALIVSEATHSDTSSTATSLASLPEDILRRVLDFLLSTKHVAHEQVAQYHDLQQRLHPAILRTNKAIYALGSSVLEGNHCILVSTKYPKLCQAFENNGGRAWKDNSRLARYQKYHLRLHIVPRRTVGPLKVAEFFMICLNSAPLFVRTLQMLYLANQPQFSIRFDLKAPSHAFSLTNKVQQEIFEPFMAIRGRHQKCSVQGIVDADIREQLERRLTQTVYWTRAEHHALQSIHVLKDRLARAAMRDGKWFIALSHFRDIDCLQKALGPTCMAMVQSEDQAMRWDYQNFTSSRHLNHCLAMLHGAWLSHDPTVSRALFQKVADHPQLIGLGGLQPNMKISVHVIRGIALFAVGRDEDAKRSCESALRGAILVKTDVQVAQLIRDFCSKKSSKRIRQTTLEQLILHLPRTAIGRPAEVHNVFVTVETYSKEFILLFTNAYNGDVSFAQPHWDKFEEHSEDDEILQNGRQVAETRDVVNRKQGLPSKEVVVGPRPDVMYPPGYQPYIFEPHQLGEVDMKALGEPDRPGPNDATIIMP